MATILFDSVKFRALFPAFSNSTTYPDAIIQIYWDTGTAYISDQYGSNYLGAMNLAQQTLALNYMAAHLAALNTAIARGDSGGIVVSSTIDKVSVTLKPPPGDNQWAWWLNQTPYGAQLLALLKLASAGGLYFGGFPVSTAFRR